MPEMPGGEAAGKLVVWVKAHPVLAGGLVLGAGVLGYLAYKKSLNAAPTLVDSPLTEDAAGAGTGDELPYAEPVPMEGPITSGLLPSYQIVNTTPGETYEPPPPIHIPTGPTFGGSDPSSLSQSYKDVPAPAKASTVTTGQSVAQKITVTSSVYAAKHEASQPPKPPTPSLIFLPPTHIGQAGV